MRSRVLALLVVLVAWLVPGIANACGEWAMTDVEKKYEVRYLINAGSIRTLKKDGSTGGRVGVQYLDDEAKNGVTVKGKGKTPALDIKDGKVLKGTKVVGTIADDGRVTFGKATYTITLGNPVEHPLASWELEVKRGDTVVLTSERASALCQTRSPEDVKRRVIFYLAWRHGHR